MNKKWFVIGVMVVVVAAFWGEHMGWWDFVPFVNAPTK